MQIINEEKPYLALFNNFKHAGAVVWIGTKSKSRAPMNIHREIHAEIGGLQGDRYHRANPESKRQVTLVQYEHLQSVASFLGISEIDPALIRRNIVVKGINLHALKGKKFKIGDAILETTDLCYPCSRMEENLGHGGFNAMRGHGGITCKVIDPGLIRLGDAIEIIRDIQ